MSNAALPTTDATPTAGLRPGVRRILLATDLSPTSAAAANQAFGLAQDLDASLLIVSVIDPEAGAPAGRLVTRMDQRRAAREAAAQSLRVEGRRRGVRVSFLVWEGEPGPSIVDAATSEAADLIIVGTRGRSRVGRMVLGSVSDHVVRHAPCPVLIARS